MNVKRTKRLTLNRALRILQLRFGTQVQKVNKYNDLYIANEINGYQKPFTRTDILNIENEIYSALGC